MHLWLWGLVLALGFALAPALALNTHQEPDLAVEHLRVLGDLARTGYVVAGCLPSKPASGLTLTLPPCQGYGLETTARRLVYLTEPTARALTLAATPGWYTLAAHHSVAQSVSGWTRVPGTHYLWQSAPNGWQAAAPAGGVLLATVQVASGSVTQVGDLRPDHPWAEAVNVLSPLWGVVGDDVTDDTAALQAAVNAAQWRRIRTVQIPPAPQGECYAITALYAGYDPAFNLTAPQDANAQGRIILQGAGHYTERDLLTALPRFGTGTCLRSTAPAGPALALVTVTAPPVSMAATAVQRVDLRDLHVQANNTSTVILVTEVSHVRWDNVSVYQQNASGRGVQLQDVFQFEWHGGMALGPGYAVGASTRPGIQITAPTTVLSGLLTFRGVTSRNWQTCWQYGLPQTTTSTQTSLLFDQIQGKGCQFAMNLFGQLGAVTLAQSYFEEFTLRGVGLAGRAKGVTVTGTSFGGASLEPAVPPAIPKAALEIGMQDIAGGNLSAGAVSVRGNDFVNTPEYTAAIVRYIHSSDDAGVELAYNNFIGPGTYIYLATDLTNQYDLRLWGNQYGASATPLVSSSGTGRPDTLGAKDFSRHGRMVQHHIAARITLDATSLELTPMNSSNVQRVLVTAGGAAKIERISTSDQGGNPISDGTEIKLFLEGNSDELWFVGAADLPGGHVKNTLLEGGVTQKLVAKGQLICFVYYNLLWQQSCKVVTLTGS